MTDHHPSPPADPAAAPPPARPSRWPAAVVLGLVALAAAGAVGWRYRVTRPDYRLVRGQEAVRAQDWTAAEGYVGRLEAAGRMDHARLLAAEVYQARGLWGQALGELNQLDPDGPFRRRAAVLAGECLLKLRNHKEAYRVFRGVVEEYPDEADGFRGLAAIAYDLGQTGNAIGHSARVAELDPADPRPYRLIGMIQADLGNLEPAEEAYRAALARDPPAKLREELRLELAETLVQLKKYPEALEQVDAARADAGGEEPAYMLLIRAQCEQGLGRVAEAKALVARALAADPAGGLLYRLQGQLLMDEDKPAEAAAALEKSLALIPAHYGSQFLLAQAYAAVGRKAEAEAAFARADELKRDNQLMSDLTRAASARPADPGVRLQLAEVCDRLQRKDLAAMWRGAAAALTAGN